MADDTLSRYPDYFKVKKNQMRFYDTRSLSCVRRIYLIVQEKLVKFIQQIEVIQDTRKIVQKVLMKVKAVPE